MRRDEILDHVKSLIYGERLHDYGEPYESFCTIAEFWETYINAHCIQVNVDDDVAHCVVKIDPQDAALMMSLFKISRYATGSAKPDSFIDLIGYAACAAEIATGNEDET